MDRTARGRVSQNDRGQRLNGESMSTVWPTLGSRTTIEHNRKTVTKFQSESHYITLVVFIRTKYSRNKFFTCQNYRNFSLQTAITNARYKTSWTTSADLSTRGSTTTRVTTIWILLKQGWWRSTVVERRSLAGELSLSCARPAADG